MVKIDWSPSFSVGVRSLDAQHKRIVDMINYLLSDPDVTVRSETISELLSRLTIYAEDHFRDEENLLEEYDYPDLARQKEEHRAYRLKVVALCRDTMEHYDLVPADLLQFMKNWWVNHILREDMKYRTFFEERSII